MADVKLIQIQFFAQGIQTEISTQMVGDIVRYRLVTGELFFFRHRMLFLVNGPVECQDQIADAEIDLGISSEAVCMQFLQQIGKLASGAVEFEQIQRIDVFFFRRGMVK